MVLLYRAAPLLAALPVAALPLLAHSTDARSAMASAEKTTVVATRNPRASFDVPAMTQTVVTDSAAQTASSTTADLLRDVPGLNIAGSARRNGQTLTMRGYGNDGLLILMDGVRQRFESGHDGQFFIDPWLIQRVEVVRGPASALYGSGALGGVVAFETVNAADLLAPGESFGARVAAGYQGVRDEFSQSASVFGRSERLDYLVSVLHRDSGDIELGDDRGKLNSDDDVVSGLVKLNASLTDTQTLGLNLQRYTNDATEPNNPQSGPDADGANETVRKETRADNWQLNYRYDDPLTPGFGLTARLYGFSAEVEETLKVATGTGAVGDRRSRELDSLGFSADARSKLGQHQLNYGLEIYSEEQDGSDSARAIANGVPDAEADYRGVYLQDEWRPALPGGDWIILAGARYDRYESENDTGTKIDEDRVSPNLGLTWQPRPWLALYARYGEAFRAPTMTEAFASGTHFSIPAAPPFFPGGSNVFVPNPDLKPETNRTTEVGFGLQFDDLVASGDALTFKVMRFETRADDYIDLEVNFTMFPTCCGTTRSVNINEAELDGWDASLDYQAGPWQLALNYSRIDGEDRDSGDPLQSLTPETLIARVDYQLLPETLSLGWRGTFAKRFDNTATAAEERDGYGVHDIYLRWQPALTKGRPLTVDIGVDNLFDKAYQRVFAEALEPGRNLRVEVAWQW